MDSLNTQVNIKNNAEDVHNFFMDMKTWEKQIRIQDNDLLKEKKSDNKNIPAPRNARSLESNNENNLTAKKISAFDYAAWDRFDVEKACEEVDKKEVAPSHNDNNKTNYNLNNAAERTTIDSAINTNYIDRFDSQQTDLFKITESKKIHNVAAQKLKNIDNAHFEKEMGNNFVKEEKWNQAIECYSRAIELDPKNAIFHANRSLCYLKLANFKIAEVDSTIAIQLDSSYVKAYQRRAMARKGMQQYMEAKADFEKVLHLEPSNKSAQSEVAKINDYLNKLTAHQNKSQSQKQPSKQTFNAKKLFCSNEATNNATGKIDRKESKESTIKPEAVASKKIKKEFIESEGPAITKVRKDEQLSPFFKNTAEITFSTPLPDNSLPISPIVKPPHLRSKEQLSQVDVKEAIDLSSFQELVKNLPGVSTKQRDETSISPVVDILLEKEVKDNINAVPLSLERNSLSISSATETTTSDHTRLSQAPRTYVQFEASWKSIIKQPSVLYQFLKLIPPQSIPGIFGSSLDSSMLSQLLATLACDECVRDTNFVYDYLTTLTLVERFKSLTLFLTSEDQKAVEKCLRNLESFYSSVNIQKLRTLYDL